MATVIEPLPTDLVQATVTVRGNSEARLRAVAAALSRGTPISLRLLPALQVLRDLRSDLARQGVERAGIFGSTARGEDKPDSDIDVLLRLGPDSKADLLDIARIGNLVREAFAARMPGIPVDVSVFEDMRSPARDRAAREAVYVD